MGRKFCTAKKNTYLTLVPGFVLGVFDDPIGVGFLNATLLFLLDIACILNFLFLLQFS